MCFINWAPMLVHISSWTGVGKWKLHLLALATADNFLIEKQRNKLIWRYLWIMLCGLWAFVKHASFWKCFILSVFIPDRSAKLSNQEVHLAVDWHFHTEKSFVNDTHSWSCRQLCLLEVKLDTPPPATIQSMQLRDQRGESEMSLIKWIIDQGVLLYLCCKPLWGT